MANEPLINPFANQEVIEPNIPGFVSTITCQNWYVRITLVVNASFKFSAIALVDSGANANCINEGAIPTQFYERTTQRLNTAKV